MHEVNSEIDIEEALQIEKDFFEGKVSITDDIVDEANTKASKAKGKGKG